MSMYIYVHTHTHKGEMPDVFYRAVGRGERVPSYYLDDRAHSNSMC